MAKWNRGGYFAAVIGSAVVVYVIFFGYYARTKTFWLTYFPDNTWKMERRRQIPIAFIGCGPRPFGSRGSVVPILNDQLAI